MCTQTIGRIAAILVSIVFSSVCFGESFEVDPEHRTCDVDADCVLFKDPCSPSCSCGLPLAKVHINLYETKLQNPCRYRGVCDMHCPANQIHCHEGKCEFVGRELPSGKDKVQIDGKWYQQSSEGGLRPLP